MFEMQYPVYKLESAAENSICVFCSNNVKHQLLELSLPSKLTIQLKNHSEKTITNDTDLKIKCGTFTDLSVTSMKTIQKDRKLIVSHSDLLGATVYKLSCDDSDEITKDSLFDCELKGAELSLSDEELVLSKNTVSPSYVLDANTGRTTRTIPATQSSSSDTVENVIPVHVDKWLLALCNKSTGKVQLYDTRQWKHVKSLNVDRGSSDSWAFTSLYSSKDECGLTSAARLALVSNKGFFNMFDARKWDIPCVKTNLGLSTEMSAIQISLRPQKVSLSGFDGNIHVYDLTTEPELMFVHDGHRHVEGFSACTQTTSHLWFPGIENLIISSATNGTIQSWQFENKNKS